MNRIRITSDRIIEGEIRFCECCGWWSRNERYRRPYFDAPDEIFYRHLWSMYGACAQLKNLDVSDISTPLDELRSYLLARYTDRFDVSPQRLEELVGSVFSEAGYDVHVTAYQNDGGIDVVLAKNDENVGVQVKRYKNRIEAEQIRAFAGALILGGHLSGIFVTTSAFRSGAIAAADKFAARGLPIELMDASRFYDALKVKKYAAISDEELEEFVYDLQAVGESKTIYEDEGPY